MLGLVLILLGCEKYLNEPSNKSFAIITSLDDLEALLEHSTMNSSPNAQEMSADNYYLTDETWEALQFEEEQNMYIWAEQNVFRSGTNTNNWSNLYRAVFVSNTVLEQLGEIPLHPSEINRREHIKGAALLFRAISFLDAAQLWAVAYDAETAQQEMGIPLRLNSDFNQPSVRASVHETYGQIVADLTAAIPLLPETPVAKTRPSKPAAYGVLARAYLWMRDYEQAQLYADSCLILIDTLLEYNELDASKSFPISRHNAEVIFERQGSPSMIMASHNALVPLDIYRSFQEGDLRKNIFFQQGSEGQVTFRGYYFGFASFMTGIATDEMYLTRAECLARNGRFEEALTDLNTLLRSRWSKDLPFEPIRLSSEEEIVDVILKERRKQLLFRGHRWMDIKRLNKEGAAISLRRVVNGKEYILQANSPRFALPLPDDLLPYFR